VAERISPSILTGAIRVDASKPDLAACSFEEAGGFASSSSGLRSCGNRPNVSSAVDLRDEQGRASPNAVILSVLIIVSVIGGLEGKVWVRCDSRVWAHLENREGSKFAYLWSPQRYYFFLSFSFRSSKRQPLYDGTLKTRLPVAYISDRESQFRSFRHMSHYRAVLALAI